jgi:SAM-dependent methyltransferase
MALHPDVAGMSAALWLARAPIIWCARRIRPMSTPVAQYFSRLADTYGGGEMYAERRHAVLEALKPELERARAVLDLGCGNGQYTAELAGMGFARLVGCDLSADMLARARERCPGVPFVQGDAARPPFRAASFDLVLCSHVLPFVGDVAAAVAAIAATLRSGGVLAATGFDSGLRGQLAPLVPGALLERFMELVFQRRSRDGRLASARWQTNALTAAIQSAGLALETRRADYRCTWAGLAESLRLRWLVLQDEERRRLAEDLFGEVERHLGSASATVALAEELLIGRKTDRRMQPPSSAR